MTVLLRFIVRVGADWKVTLECPDRPAFAVPSHTMTRVEVGSGARKRAYPERAPPGLSAADVADRQRRITNREPRPDDVAELGVHLFESLIGAECWVEMQDEAKRAGANLLELALAFPVDDVDLGRLHWELMRAPAEYLLGSSARRVALTRLVASKSARVPAIPSPPRILLVVGAPLSDASIRPAAECIAVLQETTTANRTGRTEVLLEATKSSLTAALKQSRPHVVHFVCHGSTNGARTVLELCAEDGEEGTLDAPQLLALFAAAGGAPELVVLSACYSASPGGAAFVSGEPTAPFAVELVQGGVPIVVGMAGRVADSACRLFARRFGEALVQSEPIVAAMQEGRSAAFIGNADPSKNIDWVFPIVFFAECVPPGFAVEPETSDTSQRIIKLERALGIVELRPVFCGRFEELAAFRRLLAPRARPVMAVYSEGAGTRELGKTWLLRELVARCLAFGHLPCPILPDGGEPPRTVLDVAKRIGDVVNVARRQLGLGPAANAQIPLLQKTPQEALATPHINAWIKVELDGDPTMRASVAKLAVECDLVQLRSDACAMHASRFDEKTKVVLFLDDVQRMAELGAFLDDFLGLGGLGVENDWLRVVIAFRFEPPAKEALKPVVETRNGAWSVHRLATFRADGEDMVSYQRLLMNPYKEDVNVKHSTKRLTFDYGVAQAREYVDAFRFALGELSPGRLTTEPHLHHLANVCSIPKFVVSADDEAVLESLRRRWPQ